VLARKLSEGLYIRILCDCLTSNLRIERMTSRVPYNIQPDGHAMTRFAIPMMKWVSSTKVQQTKNNKRAFKAQDDQQSPSPNRCTEKDVGLCLPSPFVQCESEVNPDRSKWSSKRTNSDSGLGNCATTFNNHVNLHVRNSKLHIASCLKSLMQQQHKGNLSLFISRSIYQSVMMLHVVGIEINISAICT
jgi:hypothetical protein